MKVVIKDCAGYDLELVYNSIKDALLEANFKVPHGKKVLLKPNVLGQHKPKEAITTHPVIVEAVVKIFKEAGCKVIIAESSGFFKDGGTAKALEVSGMVGIAEEHDVQLVNLETIPVKNIKDETAVKYKHPQISSIIFDVDLVVNLPKLKTHTLMKYTGAVKNLFGTIPGGRKQQLHAVGKNQAEFGQILVDIYQNILPRLTIMDAIIGLEGNGPGTGGIPKKTGLILVSEDSCALDIVASEMIGFDPLEVYTNRYCIERSLTDPKKIEIIGGKRKIPYKRPINAPSFASPIIGFVMKHAAMKPYAIRKKCKRCAVCKEICPVKAIALKPYPVIDKKRCISCYCCHENCPYNAMDLRGSRIIELLQKIKNKVMKSDNDKGK